MLPCAIITKGEKPLTNFAHESNIKYNLSAVVTDQEDKQEFPHTFVYDTRFNWKDKSHILRKEDKRIHTASSPAMFEARVLQCII